MTTKIRDDVNEYGTPVTVFRCEYCQVEFTVCPAVPDDRLDQWDGCLGPECASYDETRDGDLWFNEDGTMKPGIKLFRDDEFN